VSEIKQEENHLTKEESEALQKQKKEEEEKKKLKEVDKTEHVSLFCSQKGFT